MTEPENKVPKTKVVFVATYPDDKGNGPAYVSSLQTSFPEAVIVHPSFDVKRGLEALATIKELKGQELAKDTSGSEFARMVRRDFWFASHSDVMIYDLDVNPGTHFLAVAILTGIPIIGTSETLRECPIYFSGNLEAIVRPAALNVLLRSMWYPG